MRYKPWAGQAAQLDAVGRPSPSSSDTALIRAAVVIINPEKQVALVERHRDGSTYFLFPGGTLQEGESPSQAALREAHEELGVQIRLRSLIAEVLYRGNLQYYLYADITGGTFGSGIPGSFPEPEAGTYEAVWKPLATLETLDVRPAALAKALHQIAATGPPSEPLKVVEG